MISQNIPDNIKNMKLTSLLSKHVFSLNNPRAAKVVLESAKTGYDYALWGVHNGHIQDFHFHMDRILKMEEDKYYHPLRIVVCKYIFADKSFAWCDNIHSAIVYIRKYGEDVRLKDIPYYVTYIDKEFMDSDSNSLHVYDPCGVVRTDKDSLDGLLDCTVKRFLRSASRPLVENRYTLKDFCHDNPEFLTYGKTDNGSVTLEMLKGKYVFWDIDGTLATYRFNDHLASPEGDDAGMSRKEINDSVFLKRLPSRKMQKVLSCADAHHIILGHICCQKEVDDKQIWLDTYFPMCQERFLIPLEEEKHEIILAYCKENSIDLKDVIFVDDVLQILRKAERAGIRSYHISSFLDLM